MIIEWFEKRSGLWGFIGALAAVIAAIAAVATVYISGQPETQELKSKKTKSVPPVETNNLRFYKLTWSTDSGSQSEAVKNGSVIELQSKNQTFNVSVLSIDKTNNSLTIKVN
jgi:hypothetical protein